MRLARHEDFDASGRKPSRSQSPLPGVELPEGLWKVGGDPLVGLATRAELRRVSGGTLQPFATLDAANDTYTLGMIADASVYIDRSGGAKRLYITNSSFFEPSDAVSPSELADLARNLVDCGRLGGTGPALPRPRSFFARARRVARSPPQGSSRYPDFASDFSCAGSSLPPSPPISTQDIRC